MLSANQWRVVLLDHTKQANTNKTRLFERDVDYWAELLQDDQAMIQAWVDHGCLEVEGVDIQPRCLEQAKERFQALCQHLFGKDAVRVGELS